MLTATENFARVTCLDKTDVAKELVALLGAPLTALIGGARDTRSVRQWQAGDGPREATVARLKAALQVALVLEQRFQKDLIRSWFTGMNPLLNDMSPALVLADGDVREFPTVLQAARRFVSEQ